MAAAGPARQAADRGPPHDDRRRDTDAPAYAARLQDLEQARWKQLLDVQAPYRWNIRRLGLGRTLDVGCGLGRNLAHLGGRGVGVDHNAASVAVARQRGLQAYTADEFLAGPLARPASFDSLLAAHVVEHMTEADAVELLQTYLPLVRPGGKVVLITPAGEGLHHRRHARAVLRLRRGGARCARRSGCGWSGSTRSRSRGSPGGSSRTTSS